MMDMMGSVVWLSIEIFWDDRSLHLQDLDATLPIISSVGTAWKVRATLMCAFRLLV